MPPEVLVSIKSQLFRATRISTINWFLAIKLPGTSEVQTATSPLNWVESSLGRLSLQYTFVCLKNMEEVFGNSSVDPGPNTCYNFSNSTKNVAFVVQLSLASTGLLACVTVVTLILLFRGHRRFIYRLVIYLMTAVGIHAIAHIVDGLPVDRDSELVRIKEGWEGACKAFAVLDQTGHLTVTFAILWIILHLNVSLCRLRGMQDGIPQKNVPSGKRQKISRGEILGICLTFLLPFAINWIPFVWDMYGLTGTFCWIRMIRYQSCEDRKLSIALMLSMYYVPILLTSVLAFVTMLLIMALLCRGSVQMMGVARLRYRRSMKEVCFVVVYPALFIFLSASICAVIYSIVHYDHVPSHASTITYVVGINLLIVFPPLAFLLHPYSWKNFSRCRPSNNKTDTGTHYTVPPEDDDIESGYTIRGSSNFPRPNVSLISNQ